MWGQGVGGDLLPCDGAPMTGDYAHHWCVTFHPKGYPRTEYQTVVITTKATHDGPIQIADHFASINAVVIWMQPLPEYDAAIQRSIE